jgi:hypothetical protein
MSKCQGNLCSEESYMVLGEALYLHEMAEELSTLDELHEEIDSVIVLEDVLHINEERVVDGVEDVLLKFNVFELIML